MKLIIVALIAVTCFSAHAKIYKCKKDGKTVYKESPCENGEKKTTFDNKSLEQNLRAHNRLVKDSPALTYVNKPNSSTVKTDVRLTEIKLEIKRATESIDRNQEMMESKLERLQSDMANSSNNIAGATRNKGLATEMNATVSKYDSLIESDQKKLDRLISEQLRLNGKANNSNKPVDETTAQTRAASKKVKTNVRLTEIELALKSAKRDIDDLRQAQEQELRDVRKSMESSNNNEAGAVRDERLAMQMEVVVAKYKTKIDIKQRQVDRLLEEQALLAP